MSEEKLVSFTQMKDGTKEDYLLLAELEKPYLGMTADRVLEEMERHGQASLEGYRINRLQHGSAIRHPRRGRWRRHRLDCGSIAARHRRWSCATEP